MGSSTELSNLADYRNKSIEETVPSEFYDRALVEASALGDMTGFKNQKKVDILKV